MTKSIKKKVRRTQQERRETTRRLLLDAAIDCLCVHGLAGATLEVITERAGVTRGAVQHHFRTRDELILVILEEMNIRLRALADTDHFVGATYDQKLSSLFEHLWQIVNSSLFIAGIQIQLGAAADPTLAKKVMKVMIAIENDLDRRWIELFSEQGITSSRIVTARHVVQAAFRGLAIKSYRMQLNEAETERAMLSEMLRYVLNSKQRRMTVG
jgi:AcrR family transcriptional regulator